MSGACRCGNKQVDHREFLGHCSANAMCDSIMMDTWRFTVTQTLIECSPTVDPNANYGLG